MKFISLEFMLYQQNTSRKQTTNEFVSTGTQHKQEFMPLALSFLYSAIVPKSSIYVRKQEQIIMPSALFF